MESSQISCHRNELEDFAILTELFQWNSKSIEILSNGQNEIKKDDIVKIIKKPSSRSKKSSQGDLDLTGSPLRASFNLDDDENAFKHTTQP